MPDDLTLRRALRIARDRTTDQIRDDIRKFQAACPNCGIALRIHTFEAIDRCALADRNEPKEIA